MALAIIKYLHQKVFVTATEKESIEEALKGINNARFDEVTHLKDGMSVDLASKDIEKTLALSWLVPITMAADTVAPMARSLSTRPNSNLTLAI